MYIFLFFVSLVFNVPDAGSNIAVDEQGVYFLSDEMIQFAPYAGIRRSSSLMSDVMRLMSEEITSVMSLSGTSPGMQPFPSSTTAYLSVRPSVYLPIRHLFMCLSIRPFVCLSVHPFICPLVHQSVFPFIHYYRPSLSLTQLWQLLQSSHSNTEQQHKYKSLDNMAGQCSTSA